MPRQARQESKTGYYHVMTRGINKIPIFNSDREKDKIKEFIQIKLDDTENKIIIVAYCIMSNHLHILLHSEKEELIEFMKKLNISYAMYYNKKEERLGSVFQERYKSQAIEDEKYLLGALRYIHNNPIKAGIVNKIEEYHWSSAEEYLNTELQIVKDKVKNEILEKFKDKEEFIKFHDKEDKEKYLDLKEETKEKKIKQAEMIRDIYLNEIGIIDFNYRKDKAIIKEELVKRLLSKSELTYREIANMAEVSLSFVFRNKMNRP